METQGLRFATRGTVLEVRLDRVDKKNAITGAMYDAMTMAMAAAPGQGTRAIVFTAEGPVFSAGNDIRDFLAMPSLEDAPPARFIRGLMTNTLPMVAAVCGPAIGVGTTLLLHCDLVYAAPSATLTVPFVALGLVPEAGSSVLLPARIGMARASAMLLLGETMDAPAALQAGLFNAVVPADALDDHARSAAARLAAAPPQALAAARALMRPEGALHDAMRAEERAFSHALQGPEAQAAFAAFLARRRPDAYGNSLTESCNCSTL